MFCKNEHGYDHDWTTFDADFVSAEVTHSNKLDKSARLSSYMPTLLESVAYNTLEVD